MLLHNTQYYCVLYFKSLTNSIELNRIAKTTKKKKNWFPLHLFDAVSFPFHLFLSETYKKKNCFIYRKQHFRLRNPDTTREAFFYRAAKNAKKGRPAEKAVRSMHETDPSYLQSPPYLQFSGVFCYFFSIYYTFRLFVRGAYLPIVKKGFPQTNFRFFLCDRVNWYQTTIDAKHWGFNVECWFSRILLKTRKH